MSSPSITSSAKYGRMEIFPFVRSEEFGIEIQLPSTSNPLAKTLSKFKNIKSKICNFFNSKIWKSIRNICSQAAILFLYYYSYFIFDIIYFLDFTILLKFYYKNTKIGL